MSLVTLIRDYVDVANSSKQLDGSTLSSLAYYTLTFSFTAIKQAIAYCFTFHWLRDLSYYCLTSPSVLLSFTGVNGLEYAENQPLSNLLAFSDSNFATGIGIVFLGFFNGFFSCIHFSAANLITIQRMLVQGVQAGLCSAFGTALGQFSFLACVLFGFRSFLFPWLALEPLHFFIGTAILLSIASASAQDRRTPTVQWSTKSPLFVYLFTNMALAWCEQSAIFQCMGNISFGAEPTFLETTPSFETSQTVLENIQSLTHNASYLFTFFLGNILGISFLSFGLQRLLELILRSKGIAIYYGLIKQANLPLATLVFAFGFGSLPYYGFDYLITKGFGFIPNEHAFQQTLFSPTTLVSKTTQAKEASQGRLEDQLALLFTLEGEKSKSFAVDTTPFDDGQYIKANQKRPQTFEDLNYRGEHLWTNRLSRISNIREQANQTQSSFLGPIFSWMRSFLWGDGPTAKPSTVTSPNADQQRWLEDGINTPVQDRLLLEKQKRELSPEREQVDNYVKEFDRQFEKGFSPFYSADPQSLIEVEDQWQEKRIKEKCYTNPIYTFLLNTEIDAFLTRQPKSQWLSPKEESLLLKRQQLLSNYYETLALTSQITASDALSQLVPKSYANTVYNHQFKGTLKTARRLFSIRTEKEPSTLSSMVNSNNGMIPSQQRSTSSPYPTGKEAVPPVPTKLGMLVEVANGEKGQVEQVVTAKKIAGKRTVKFDQPLFLGDQLENKTDQEIKKLAFHEELNPSASEPKQTLSSKDIPSTMVRSSQKDTDSTVPGATSNSFASQTVSSTNPNIFFLEQAEPLPLYASWDQELRKLILTNRFQSRAVAGYTLPPPSVFDKSSLASTNSTNNTSYTVPAAPPKVGSEGKVVEVLPKGTNAARADFTTWPLPSPFANSKKAISTTARKMNEQLFADPRFSSSTLVEGNIDPAVSTYNVPPEVVEVLPKGTNGDKAATSHPSSPFRQSKDKGQEQVVNQKRYVESMLSKSGGQQTNRFLFQSNAFQEPSEFITNDMVNALLQWQKLIKDNKQLSKEDKQVSKEKVAHWPENINRAYWSNELIDNDLEFDEPTESVLKKQKLLWEFLPPNHGGFLWPGRFWNIPQGN